MQLSICGVVRMEDKDVITVKKRMKVIRGMLNSAVMELDELSDYLQDRIEV